MINGANNISRGWPAIQVFKLASETTKPPSEATGDEVVLTAVQHPPRIGETRPISALLPDVLARYGFGVSDSATSKNESSIDVSA